MGGTGHAGPTAKVHARPRQGKIFMRIRAIHTTSSPLLPPTPKVSSQPLGKPLQGIWRGKGNGGLKEGFCQLAIMTRTQNNARMRFAPFESYLMVLMVFLFEPLPTITPLYPLQSPRKNHYKTSGGIPPTLRLPGKNLSKAFGGV